MRQPTVPRKSSAACAVLAVLAILAVLGLCPGRAAAQAVRQVSGPEVLGFTKHFTVAITNPSALTLENHVVIIDVDDIRAEAAPDFNTYMYAFFDNSRGEYALVVSQADDFDKDRYHDEIVLVRTLPPSSTTRLICYYAPERSYQLMPTAKAFARTGWTGGPEAGWESTLAAYAFAGGRIDLYGKLQAGLVLKGFPAAETRTKDWGMKVLEAEGTPGLGGLAVWDGGTRIPLFGPGAPQAKLTVVAPGPVRAVVKAEYPAVKTAAGDVALTVLFSAFAENAYSRQDVRVAANPGAAPAVVAPGLPELPTATWSLEKDKGAWSVWGRGAEKAGQIGLAAIFDPAHFAGLDQSGHGYRAVKLGGYAGGKLTYWVEGAWDRGVGAPAPADAKTWARRIQDLAARLLVPVKVEFTAR